MGTMEHDELHAFNDELLLILDLQTLQCVIFIVQEGEVVLQGEQRG